MQVGDEPRAELFRPAAVAAHRAGSGPTASLDSSPRLTSWAYRGLLALVVAAIVAMFTVRVEETSSGVWVADEGGLAATVALPIGALDRLAPGQRVGLRAGAETPVLHSRVRAVLAPLPLSAALARFGPLPRSLRVGTAVALIEVALPTHGSTRGTATAHLARHTLAEELVPGLRHETTSRG